MSSKCIATQPLIDDVIDRKMEKDIINNALSLSSLYDSNIFSVIDSYIYSQEVNYYDTGDIMFVANYRFDEKDGLYEEWYMQGVKAIKCNYKNDKLDGLYQEWYTNGVKIIECTFKNDEKEGLQQMWYDNGNNHIKCTYKNGKRDGLYQYWYFNGEYEDCIYKDDNQI